MTTEAIPVLKLWKEGNSCSNALSRYLGKYGMPLCAVFLGKITHPKITHTIMKNPLIW
jgi:hypothetical protein